jgi:hypothetical protein
LIKGFWFCLHEECFESVGRMRLFLVVDNKHSMKRIPEHSL